MKEKYDLLILSIEKYQKINLDDVLLLQKYFQYKTYDKDEYVLKENQVADKVYFILDGATHQFYTLENGDQKTCNFSFSTNFITDVESFSKKIPCNTNIIALRKTETLFITCENLNFLLEKSQNLNTFFRLIIEEVALEGIKRTKLLLSETPQKRYELLLKENPKLFQEVPQKLIAQYLGIQPESFSRLKRRMTKS